MSYDKPKVTIDLDEYNELVAFKKKYADVVAMHLLNEQQSEDKFLVGRRICVQEIQSFIVPLSKSNKQFYGTIQKIDTHHHEWKYICRVNDELQILL